VRSSLAGGFEPLISVSLMSDRAVTTTIAITYDREVTGEDARAIDCFRTLLDELVTRGYPPYRLNICAMEYARMSGPYADVLRRLKETLDPERILAPGRYEPS
jgi:4-cresol dehydrogenase (hydroxylating)